MKRIYSRVTAKTGITDLSIMVRNNLRGMKPLLAQQDNIPNNWWYDRPAKKKQNVKKSILFRSRCASNTERFNYEARSLTNRLRGSLIPLGIRE